MTRPTTRPATGIWTPFTRRPRVSVIPTRRPWITASRLVAAVVLLAVGSSTVLLLAGPESLAVGCLVSAL